MDHLAALPAELLLCIAAAHGNPLGLLLTAPPSKGLQASFAEALATLEHVCLGIELRGHIATLASAAAAVLDPVGVSAAVRAWLPDPLTRHGTYTGDAPRCRDALCIALLERCGRLRSLNLRGCRDLSAEHLFQSLSLRGGGASLTSLDLSGTRLLVCTREAQAVAAGCAQLTSLGLGRCTVSHGALAAVARGCQGLATLCFTDAEFCWRDTRRRYGKQSADNTRGAADAAVVELATTCTRLTSLGLGGADITDAAVVALASCKLLTTLDLRCCTEITDMSVAVVAWGCKLLTSLSLGGCRNITGPRTMSCLRYLGQEISKHRGRHLQHV